MIETYKLLLGKYDSQVALKLPLYLSDDHHMRRNSRKLLVMSLWFKKIFFSNRIINIWNSLTDSVVMADTVNQFKHRLDKYWENYNFVYDHRATYTGTGGRLWV